MKSPDAAVPLPVRKAPTGALALAAGLSGLCLHSHLHAAPEPTLRSEIAALGSNLLGKGAEVDAAFKRDTLRRRQRDAPVLKADFLQSLRQAAMVRQQRVAAFLAAPANRNALQRLSGTVVDVAPDGRPVIVDVSNAVCAITSGASAVRDNPLYLNVTGAGVNIGCWDAITSRIADHDELADQFTYSEDPALSTWSDFSPRIGHGYHVIGTMIASGSLDPAARGMAPGAKVLGWDFSDNLAGSTHTEEMTAWGASSLAEVDQGRLQISNHSYGPCIGWLFNRPDSEWYWLGPEPAAEDPRFGKYSQLSREADDATRFNRYYLPFFAAGNHRNESPPVYPQYYFWYTGDEWEWTWVNNEFDKRPDPLPDGDYDNGYDCIGGWALAKNVLTVGAVSVPKVGDSYEPGLAEPASFSSWGPTDDGRVKPDLVARGVDVYSTVGRTTGENATENSHETKSGTSMASPTACGSTALLLELFKKRFNTHPTAALIKAMLIHHARDLGNPGPDYIFGHGLMDTKAVADTIERDAATTAFEHFHEHVRLLMDGEETVLQFYRYPSPDLPPKVTLAYQDLPGTPNTGGLDDSTPALVNDLDLTLVSTSGETQFPWRGDVANPSANFSRGDNDVDNVEVLDSSAEDSFTPGLVRVIVRQDGPLQANQHFALVQTGLRTQPLAPTPIFAGAWERHFQRGALPLPADGVSFTVQPENVPVNGPFPPVGRIFAEQVPGGDGDEPENVLRLDSLPGQAVGAVSEVTIHQNMSGLTDRIMEFSWRDLSLAGEQQPETSTGRATGDALCVSTDGVTWHRLMHLHAAQLQTRKVESINVSQAMASLGLPVTANVRFRFSQKSSILGGGLQLGTVSFHGSSAGDLRFVKEQQQVLEATQNTAPTVRAWVRRAGGTTGPLSVDYATINGTAQADRDFTATSGTLQFADGQALAYIDVPLLDNQNKDGSRRFLVRLSNVSHGTLGAPSVHQVEILDDDDAPWLEVYPPLIRPAALVDSNAPTQSLHVYNRGGGAPRLHMESSATWLEIARPSGRAQGHGNNQLSPPFSTELRYHTAGLAPGRYTASVRIVTEDGNQPTIEVPVHLLVGYPGTTIQVTAQGTQVPADPNVPSNAVAADYPVVLPVSSTPGVVRAVRLKIDGLTAPDLTDVDALLQRPDNRSAWAFSDLHWPWGMPPFPFVLQLEEPGQTWLGMVHGRPAPLNLPDSRWNLPLYANDPGDAMPAPAETELAMTKFADLCGSTPGGQWRLFLRDDTPNASLTTIGNVTLELDTVLLYDSLHQQFSADSPNTLSSTSLLFTPAENAAGYETQRHAITRLPANPDNHFDITAPPDRYTRVDFSLDATEFVSLYGVPYRVAWVGENGSILFADPGSGAVDPAFNGQTITEHLRLPRVSSWFGDLQKTQTSRLSYEFDGTARKLIVTWQNFRDASTQLPVTSQAEIFHDGRVRLSYLGVPPNGQPLVGLSRGYGQSANSLSAPLSAAPVPQFVISDLAVSPDHTSLSFRVPTLPDSEYEIQTSPDLVTWTPLRRFRTSSTETGTAVSINMTPDQSPAMFVRVLPVW